MQHNFDDAFAAQQAQLRPYKMRSWWQSSGHLLSSLRPDCCALLSS